MRIANGTAWVLAALIVLLIIVVYLLVMRSRRKRRGKHSYPALDCSTLPAAQQAQCQAANNICSQLFTGADQIACLGAVGACMGAVTVGQSQSNFGHGPDTPAGMVLPAGVLDVLTAIPDCANAVLTRRRSLPGP